MVTAHPAPPSVAGQAQEIRFCGGAGDVRLAWASHGSGPPLILVSCWLSHLQHDWQSPVWRHFLDDLGRMATVIRYDERGFGLSDWSVDDFSLDARLGDLEAVVDAAGHERFAMMGMSGGAPVAISYAAKHPERVTRLILYGGGTAGFAPRNAEEAAEQAAYEALIRAGWAKPESRFRRVFTTGFIPGATEEQMRWLDDLQRMATSTENAVASRAGRMHADVRPLLSAIRAPTLVVHARDDHMVEFESARAASATIPNARLAPLESSNHILLADDPAWPEFLREVETFMDADVRSAPAGDTAADAVAALSTREREILRLTADGLTNDEIADRLTLSPRTVERHLSNAYVKLGVSGKAARTAAATTLVREELR